MSPVHKNAHEICEFLRFGDPYINRSKDSCMFGGRVFYMQAVLFILEIVKIELHI